MNFHISRATSRVYAVASHRALSAGSETPHLVRLAEMLYRRIARALIRILNLARVNSTPRRVGRVWKFAKAVKRECATPCTLDIALCATVSFLWTIVPLSSLVCHPRRRRVGKRLELSNVKCKTQYYRVRPRPSASPTSTSLSSLSLSFPILFLSFHFTHSHVRPDTIKLGL